MLDVFRLYVLTFYETFCSVSFKHGVQSMTKSNLWRFGFFVASDYFLWANITARECYAHQWRSQSLVADGFVKGILVLYSVPKIRLLHRDLLDIHRLTSDLRHKHKIDLTYFIALWLRIYKSAYVTCWPSIRHASTTSSLIFCSKGQTK